MKKNEVKVGGLYVAKVSDKLVTVRIESSNTKGGWNATNTTTGKRIHIKSAQRLHGKAGKPTDAKAPTVAKTAGEVKTAAAGDDKSKEPVKTASKKGKKPDNEKKPKRVTALDAAAAVLAKSDKPMRAQELITAMTKQGLWSSPAGKTPQATLYAGMLREARDKGNAARFKKVDRGMFAFNKAGN